MEARLRNIVEALTFDVYNYTCLSLFECHKLMFSFQVSTQDWRGHDLLCHLSSINFLLHCIFVDCDLLEMHAEQPHV